MIENVAADVYLDPRDRVHAASLEGDERETVVTTVARYRRAERLRVGDPVPAVTLIRLEDGELVPIATLLDDRPLVLVFGSCSRISTTTSSSRSTDPSTSGLRRHAPVSRDSG